MTTLLSLLDHPRLPFGALFLITAGLLGFGLYLEHWEGLEPCPLCIFQRLAYLAVGAVALLAGLHGARGVFRRVYAALLLLGRLPVPVSPGVRSGCNTCLRSRCPNAVWASSSCWRRTHSGR